ncbi:MAG: hypothetical protein WD114_02960 [Phycisphaerales bacterium]
MSKDDKDITISRAVGRFLGHLWGASTKPVPTEPDSEPRSRVVGHETTEAEGSIDGKKIVLRRTTIDEVEIREEPGEPGGGGSGQGPGGGPGGA